MMAGRIFKLCDDGIRHILHYLKYACSILWILPPSKKGFKLALECYVNRLHIFSPIPIVELEEIFESCKIIDNNQRVEMRLGFSTFASTNTYEKYILGSLVKLIAPKSILEIGTYKGATTWHLFFNAPKDTVVYTFDLPENEKLGNVTDFKLTYNKVREYLPDSPRIRFMLQNTRKWDGILENKVQFVFIDGDHSYEGVKNDTEKALRCLDEIGCVVWHDSFGREAGYGVHYYLKNLLYSGKRIFRLVGRHEISSLAIWMTNALEKKLGLSEIIDKRFN